MPAKARSVDDFVEALSELPVLEALAKALAPFINKTLDKYITTRLNGMASEIEGLKAVNADLKNEVLSRSQRIEDLQAYSMSENLIICGVPERTAAERATGSIDSSAIQFTDSNESVESTFISFCHDSLNITVSPQDISIAHRLRAGSKDTARPIIVRFTSRRIRNHVPQARKLLKGLTSRVYIS